MGRTQQVKRQRPIDTALDGKAVTVEEARRKLEAGEGIQVLYWKNPKDGIYWCTRTGCNFSRPAGKNRSKFEVATHFRRQHLQCESLLQEPVCEFCDFRSSTQVHLPHHLKTGIHEEKSSGACPQNCGRTWFPSTVFEGTGSLYHDHLKQQCPRRPLRPPGLWNRNWNIEDKCFDYLSDDRKERKRQHRRTNEPKSASDDPAGLRMERPSQPGQSQTSNRKPPGTNVFESVAVQPLQQGESRFERSADPTLADGFDDGLYHFQRHLIQPHQSLQDPSMDLLASRPHYSQNHSSTGAFPYHDSYSTPQPMDHPYGYHPLNDPTILNNCTYPSESVPTFDSLESFPTLPHDNLSPTHPFSSNPYRVPFDDAGLTAPQNFTHLSHFVPALFENPAHSGALQNQEVAHQPLLDIHDFTNVPSFVRPVFHPRYGPLNYSNPFTAQRRPPTHRVNVQSFPTLPIHAHTYHHHLPSNDSPGWQPIAEAGTSASDPAGRYPLTRGAQRGEVHRQRRFYN